MTESLEFLFPSCICFRSLSRDFEFYVYLMGIVFVKSLGHIWKLMHIKQRMDGIILSMCELPSFVYERGLFQGCRTVIIFP